MIGGLSGQVLSMTPVHTKEEKTQLTFGEALNALNEQNVEIARTSWIYKDKFLATIEMKEINGKNRMLCGEGAIKSIWDPRDTDLVACDWVVVNKGDI